MRIVVFLLLIIVALGVYAPQTVHAPLSERAAVKTEMTGAVAATTTLPVAKAPTATKATPSPPAQKPPPPPQELTPPKETPPPAPSTEVSEMARVEAEVIRLTNLERVAQGLSPLSADSRLRTIAWSHSADMIARNFFAHNNLDGCGSSCRADNAGYAWRMIGENLYMMSGFGFSPEKSAEMIVQGWMNSDGHRTNIIREGYTNTGVGAVVLGDTIYVTALYATPR